ncbi:MAG: pyridoxamine 5'-phosphate oxidase family protein [Alphaproteobacteria bacterium]|nr:pyridoxamine 5'-phosphate oxidase family protein [Alphaproteobacteria bacterium]
MSNAARDLPSLDRITTTEQLEALYGEPLPRSLVKEIDHISDHYRAFIEHSPFVIVATSGPEGMDCSPRGDPPGFVRVQDRKTVLIPDRRGNNRIDTLRNLVRDPRISLLFLVPGVGETLRINGRAEIVADPDLCASFTMQGKPARSVLVVTADRVYFQCQKALARSRLWDPDARVTRSELPTAGQIIQALSTESFDAESYDRSYPEHMKKTIY